MNQANLGKKPLFTDEQLIPAAAAAKKFGAMSDRAQSSPLFVTGKQGKPKTVILGYELYLKIYARLAELEEAEHARVLATRLGEITKDPISNSVPWRSVRKSNG